MMIIIIISYSVRSEFVLVHLLISSKNYITRTLASTSTYSSYVCAVREQPSIEFVHLLSTTELSQVYPAFPTSNREPSISITICSVCSAVFVLVLTYTQPDNTEIVYIYHSIIFLLHIFRHIFRSVFIFYVVTHPIRLCENDISSWRIR